MTGLMAMQAQAGERDLERLQDEAVERLQAYVRIDTVNPPGNESRGVEYLAQLLASAGIKVETAESAPGRGNLWARLEGGPGKALVLLHHIDVVPADPRFWTTAPLGGEIRDGYLYGRGTVDTKGLGIFGLQAFIELHRAGKPLSRPVIFVATADEEAGGEFGAGWLVQNRPEIFADAGLLLNEGGSGIESGTRQMLGVEAAQKVPLWLRLTVTDRPGHGSAPRPQSSVTRLVRALDIIARNPFEPRVVPAVDQYAKARAAAGIGSQPERAADLGAAIGDAEFLKQVRAEDPAFAALLQDTCAVTRLHGSDKINDDTARGVGRDRLPLAAGPGSGRVHRAAPQADWRRRRRDPEADELGADDVAGRFAAVRRDRGRRGEASSGSEGHAGRADRIHRQPFLPRARNRSLRLRADHAAGRGDRGCTATTSDCRSRTSAAAR